MKSESGRNFTDLTLSFAKDYQNLFEAKDLFEKELIDFIKSIQMTHPEKLNDWLWGWDTNTVGSNEYNDYEKFLDDRPFLIEIGSRIYLFNHNKNNKYYAHFGFCNDLEKKGQGICFFTGICPEGDDEGKLKNSNINKIFTPQFLYDDTCIMYGCNIPTQKLNSKSAKEKVSELVKVWNSFKNRRQ